MAPLTALLLRWFDRHRRDLPWRRTRDPWAIWVSEVMLQQTRVEAVLVAYQRFMARFPRPADFAAASDDELQAAWRGLGYYRRARLLRDGAAAVVRDHGGVVPDTAAALGELPGVGAYTRGAVASIAFGRRELAVDGNVERVVARHRALRENVKARTVQDEIRVVVTEWMDEARPGDFNQALMELGALVCTPRSPRCSECPLAADCRGREQGITAELPVRPAPRAPVEVEARVLVAQVTGGVLACRIAEDQVNAGQVELPGLGALRSCDAADLAAVLRERFGCSATIGPVLATVPHAITHHRIRLHAHSGEVARRGTLTPFDPTDPEVPWSTLSRKVFAAAMHGLGDADA